MYNTVRRAFIETFKLFLISIGCSVIFSLMIYRESALPNRFVCFILNLSALCLFDLLTFKSWSKLYLQSYNAAEYFIPSLASFFVYTIVSAFLYSRRFILYMWMFLPTRFLEPVLTGRFDFISYIVAQIIMLVLVFVTPVITVDKM